MCVYVHTYLLHPSPITLEIDLGSIGNCLLSYVNTKQTCKLNKQKKKDM